MKRTLILWILFWSMRIGYEPLILAEAEKRSEESLYQLKTSQEIRRFFAPLKKTPGTALNLEDGISFELNPEIEPQAVKLLARFLKKISPLYEIKTRARVTLPRYEVVQSLRLGPRGSQLERTSRLFEEGFKQHEWVVLQKFLWTINAEILREYYEARQRILDIYYRALAGDGQVRIRYGDGTETIFRTPPFFTLRELERYLAYELVRKKQVKEEIEFHYDPSDSFLSTVGTERVKLSLTDVSKASSRIWLSPRVNPATEAEPI